MSEYWPWKYFSRQEVECKCGCGMIPLPQLMELLDLLREKLGWPVVTTSVARCAKHNVAVADTGVNGPHVRGLAADIKVSGAKAWQLVRLAMKLGFTGIGIKQKGPIDSRMVHIDCVSIEDKKIPRPNIWSY